VLNSFQNSDEFLVVTLTSHVGHCPGHTSPSLCQIFNVSLGSMLMCVPGLVVALHVVPVAEDVAIYAAGDARDVRHLGQIVAVHTGVARGPHLHVFVELTVRGLGCG